MPAGKAAKTAKRKVVDSDVADCSTLLDKEKVVQEPDAATDHTSAHRQHYFNELEQTQIDSIKPYRSGHLELASFSGQYKYSVTERLSGQPTTDPLASYRNSLVSNFGECSQLQKDMLTVLSSHTDVLYPNWTLDTAEALRAAYTLHALNHVLANRKIILEHNEKLGKMAQKAAPAPVEVPEAFRDQGIVRPKVLILVPFRSRAHHIVSLMAKLLSGNAEATEGVSSKKPRRSLITNRKRFDNEFLPDPNELESKRQDLPADFKQIFSGNIDDCFRIGVSVAKKALKLYVDIYAADMVIASPLGLRSMMGAQGDEHYDFDFLSSVELLVVDECDVLMMQNWAHVLHIFQHLHRTPSKDRGADYSRVHLWALNGWAAQYRQTLLLSAVPAAELHALMTAHCNNYAGQLLVRPSIPDVGVCAQLVVRVSQTLHRLTCAPGVDRTQARFDCFTKQLLSKCLSARLQHLLIVVPDYYDFVRLRNYMKREGLPAVFCCEYSSNKKIAAARAMLFNASKNIMVATERWHFFKRYQLRGVHHVVFYQPPLYAKLYVELVNMLQLSVLAQPGLLVTAAMLYTKYDALRMATIFGETRAAEMLASEKHIHIVTNQ